MSAAATHVLVAGLPDSIAAWLARHLPGFGVEVAPDGPAALRALDGGGGGFGLVIVDHDLSGAPAREVLARAAAAHIPVFLCLPRGGEAGLTRAEVEALGIRRLFYHPLDRDELAREAAALLRASAPASDAPATTSDAPDAPTTGEGARGGMGGMVAQAWERFRGAVLERVDAVERAALAALEGGLDEETRRHAEREAHKLAGSVGTFGFAQGSRLARETETILQGTAPLGQAEALRLTDLAAALRRELAKPPAGEGRSA